jgi:hypothetical protein
METRRWTNPSLPQTLQIGVFLLYADAVLGLLFGYFLSLIGLLVMVASAAAGYGIANERKWGYQLGVAVALFGLLPFALLLADDGLDSLFDLPVLLALIFPAAKFALLVHPQSRDYQRVWFR